MEGLETMLAGVIARIADGSLGAVGAQLWNSLRRLVEQAHGKADQAVLPAPERVGQDEIVEIAEQLARAVHRDDTFGDAVRQWLRQAETMLGDGNVSNTIIGDVSRGKVVQARDVGRVDLD